MTKIMLVRDRNTFNTKWVCNFASQLVERGYQVDLVADSYAKSGNLIVENPKFHAINLSSPSKNLFKNIWLKIREHIPFIAYFRYKKLLNESKPDVIICYFLKDLIHVSLFHKHNIPIIMMMHNPPNEVFVKVNNFLKKYIVSSAFKKVSVVQVLMKDFVSEIKDVFPNKDVVVIANQVIQQEKSVDLNVEHKKIIHVAQITAKKRQQVVVEAFAKIADQFPDWRVEFFGKVKRGRHTRFYKKLLKRVKELGLEDRLLFRGYTNDITSEYLTSDINTLPSYAEGFGYGLADGLALGIPGIGFEYAASINELIKNNETGFLAKDVDDYAEKLALLMKDKQLRIKMGAKAKEDMKRYAPKIIIDQWVNLVERVLRK